ncbi:MAG TPA: proprotein convertase P-domain-containing protein [Sedimentisphaerales bacterium]|nr:proprotein convertase P-domain-containing protein [Sedimentisphaerales bacterium]
MDAQRQKQRIVSLLAVVMALAPAASADLTLIYTGSFDLRIPVEPQTGHAWMNDAVINVPESFTVIDLDVEITLEHTSVFDLQLFVRSPDATALTLIYYDPADEFFEGQNYTATIFDDEADTPIESGHAPFTGRFTPRAPAELTVFDGRDPQGPWTIRIYDSWYANVGALYEVKLIFQTPEPAAFLLLLLGIPLARPQKP